MDIIGINEAFGLELFEGDIKMDMKKERNTIIGNEYRWPLTVPYFLENGLDMNAKAVILKAFERFRLKTCIDFKPWEGEQHYISFFKDNGCYSYVGNLHKGKQYLSIGSGCDTYETVQHELLHALGFWHEQSRSDRDDYITIAWDMIDPGKRSNFNKYNDSLVNSLNTPYDYTSVMHYGKGAFQMGIEPTIITNNPLFNNIIGGQVDFSEIDQRKLNQLYNCTSSLSFMDSCSFELDDICAMVQSLDDDTDWQRVSQILGGPSSDHTYLGQDKASGYFMHFNTSRGNVWDRAMLESRLFYPKRGFQCLEFFYYNSGNESDQLNIWIREYTASAPNGTLKLIDSLQGEPADYWQLHYSSFNIQNKFRFVFEGVKGNGSSNGGFAVDDINLSETRCPHFVWHIRKFTHDSAKLGLLSKPYYSKDGYAFRIQLKESTPFNFLFFLHLQSGANDDSLQWPCPWRQATVEFMDQHPNIQQRTSNVKTITTDPTQLYAGSYAWHRPSFIGSVNTYPNGTMYYINLGFGNTVFTSKEWLYRRDFLKGGDAFILISMEDISNLTVPQPTPVPTTSTQQTTLTTSQTTSSNSQLPALCANNFCKNDGICIMENQKPVCRCKAVGDWWYGGETCERRISSKANVLSFSCTLFVAITAITVGTLVTVI
ncbi:meprin A subunit beta-like isoform 2-T2 [Discoglossus pictus]